jgi:hypothetical protein
MNQIEQLQSQNAQALQNAYQHLISLSFWQGVLITLSILFLVLLTLKMLRAEGDQSWREFIMTLANKEPKTGVIENVRVER